MDSPIRVLLVEDSPADAKMATLILEESGLPHMVSVVHDGSEALAYLHQDLPYSDAPVPNLVLLDLNLPKVDSIAVLHAIKILRGEGRTIGAVIVLSGFGDPGSHRAALALGADAYFAKPQNLAEMQALAANIRGIWNRVNLKL